MRVKLTSICTPKQYKTISKKDLIEDGEFVVYGANGIIGRANHYTHSDSMLLITCRGATCGQLNISEPYSYINGNAMTLDDLDKNVDLKYLYYQLLGNDFNNVITGSAQPQITKVSLEKLYVYVPPLTQQKTIAKTLDKAKELIELRKTSIEKLDELSKSVFIDMFGDPYLNLKKYEKKTMSKIGNVQTGNTPPRKDIENYGNFIEWIKSDNILKNKIYVSTAKEFLSKEGYKKGRIASKNSLLFTCIAGSMSSIGSLAITNRDVAFNQQINSLTSINDNIKYLYHLFKLMKRYFEENSSKSMKIMINKTSFENLSFPIAPIEEQNKFAKTIQKIETQKALYEKELVKLEENFEALLAKSFG